MKKKAQKKPISLNRETVAILQQVASGLYQNQAEIGAASGGPEICWFSDCNPC